MCRHSFPKPPKSYQVIYADPPWPYKFVNVAGGVPYPTMTMEEICALPVASVADHAGASLFLWTTGPMMENAMAVIRAWGFEYVTVFKTWRKLTSEGKPVCGPGWWSRPCTEFLLVAASGRHRVSRCVCNEPQEFSSVRGRHSAKPVAIREMIERYHAGAVSRLELFARPSLEEGHGSPSAWDLWGLDVPGYYRSSLCDDGGHVDGGVDITLEAPPTVVSVTRKPEKGNKRSPQTRNGEIPTNHTDFDIVWKRLHADYAVPEKRITRHKGDCGCFLCRRSRP